MAEARGQALKVNAVCFLIFTSLALLVRMGVRLRTRKFWVDDWMLLVAVAFFNTFTGLYLLALYWGVDKHAHDARIKSGRNALQAWFYADLFHTLCATLLKVAAGYQIYRHTTRLWQRKMIWVLAVINIILNTYMFFILIFRCKPITWFWERMMYNPHRAINPPVGICNSWAARNSMHAQSAIGALTDFAFATLPVFMMRDLDLARIQKVALWFVVILAELSGVAMLARIPAIVNITFRRRAFPFNSIPFGVLNTIESGLIILALCLATFSPFLPSARSTPSRRPFTRFDMESQSQLSGIPLQNSMGHSTRVSAGEDKIPKKPVAARSTSKNDSSDTGRVDSSETMVDWKGGIVKTTHISHSTDDLGRLAQPSSTLVR